MAEKRIPDPTLMARLQLSVKGIDWAAGLVAAHQHAQPNGEWSAHQHLFHLVAVERIVFQTRIGRMIAEDRPTFANWDEAAYMQTEYHSNDDLEFLAQLVMDERDKTVEVLKSLTPEQWSRTGTWPSGEVDIAWAAERALAHALEHFVAILNLHQELERHQARAWLA